MSKSKLDNNETPVIQSEAIETEVIESKVTGSEPVVVKKGSFMNFLAFVFSLMALGLSGYMYYINHYTTSSSQDDGDLLKSSIAAIEKKSNQISQLLDSTNQRNQQLSLKLNALQEEVNQSSAASTLVSDTTSSNQTVKAFDDSSLKQQITDLTNEVSQQNQLVEELQKNLNTSNVQYSLSLEKLNTDLKINNQSNNNFPSISQDSQTKIVAGSILQEAYMQLNIKGNITKSQDLISKTITQLSQLTGMRYGRLANELKEISQQITDTEQPDVELLNTKINQLSDMSNKLEFTQGEILQNSDKNSSWFDNLITIKKIDENHKPKLTKSEQITINNIINSHYKMLQLALMSKNQDLWLSELEQVKNLLTLHFADNAIDINSQLSAMKAIDLNPELPNLEGYLQQFKAINLANENE